MNHLLSDIEAHFEKEYPREGCGVLAVSEGKLKFHPCRNVAKDDEDFILDSKEYFKLMRSTDIVGIVHSHPDTSPQPSESDINSCNAVGIKYYIFSYPGMDMEVLEPRIDTKELFGREYKFGVSDCFEAMRDFLASQNILIPPRAPFEDDWWKKGLDYFTEEIISEWGFKKVDQTTIKPNDLLIFSIFAQVGNHCGVYLGNEVFYHHAINRLSCRESLYPMWGKYLIGAYRHETQCVS